MRRANNNPAASQPLRLLFDVEASAQILSLSPETIDRLVELGLLVPSVVVGRRKLFSVLALQEFAHANPRKINLNPGVEAVPT